MKNFLCKIGIHDWEILKTEFASTIEEKYKKYKCDVESAINYEYEICLRCDKIKNGIEDYKHFLYQLDRRKKIALEKYEK